MKRPNNVVKNSKLTERIIVKRLDIVLAKFSRQIIIYFLMINCLNASSQIFSEKSIVAGSDGKQIYVADGDAIVYDIASQCVVKRYKPGFGGADIIDVNKDALLLGSDTKFAIFNLNSGIVKTYDVTKKRTGTDHAGFLLLNADNTKVFTTYDKEESVYIIDATNGNVISKSFSQPASDINRMDISPDRKTLAVVYHNRDKGEYFLCIWDANTEKLMKKVSLETSVHCMAFNQSSTELVLGLDYKFIKGQTKYKISWDGRIDTYPLSLQVYSIPGGKEIKEIPTLEDNPYSVCFDADNPEIFYTTSKIYGMMSFDNASKKFQKISPYPGTNTSNLCSMKGYYAASVGYETFVYSTQNTNEPIMLYHEEYRPYYFDNTGNRLEETEPVNARLLFGISYKYGPEKAQWFVVERSGLYDCSGDLDKSFKWMDLTTFKAGEKAPRLLEKLTKTDGYKYLIGSLAAVIKENTWSGSQAKAFFDAAGLDFEPYLEYFGMKKKAEVVQNVNMIHPTGDTWEAACVAASAQMKNDGFSVVTEKSGNSDGLNGSFNLDGDYTLRWYVLADKAGTKLSISGPKGSRDAGMEQDGSKPLYFNSGEDNVSVGNYSINLTGGEKGYIIAGTKALISDQEQARQKLIDQGYTIIFDRTGNAEPHNPVSTEIEEAGEIAWIAFTQEKCGLIVSVNAVNTGTTELQNEMIVNTGAHFIETGKTVRMQAVTLYCGSPVTFIIGIK